METHRPINTMKHPSVGEVRLLKGTPFYQGQENMNRFLLELDPDSLLFNFRKASGLDTGDAEPMTGWDADECKLKGHTTGHYLSGLSLAFAATGDARFGSRLDYMIGGLTECRDAFARTGKVHPGFLSAYDEEQFDLLEEFTKYPEIWAPYYTLDKIMAGLLDAYELCGKTAALEILDPLGDWVYERLSRLDEETRARMWSMYIAGEYGAMIGTMVRLYRITGKRTHLEAARLFENDKLFIQMAEGRDELDTMHANQHIPQIIGALELYSETADKRYLEIAANFEKIVTEHHCYVNGGTGEEERFHAADDECSYLTEKTAESCASVNMLRLTGRLYEYSADDPERAELMDYYERTLFNHILMSWSHEPDGGTTYFLPMAPGSSKYYEREENSCCHGTGLESRYRYMTDIFAWDEEENGYLRVELPVSSSLKAQECVTVSFSEDGSLSVRADQDMKRRLAVRIPEWARPGFPEAASGYVLYEDRLKAGETVTLSLNPKMRMVTIPSDHRYCSVAKGPYLLAALSDSKEFLRFRGISSDETAFRPLYDVDGEPYHIYFLKEQ